MSAPEPLSLLLLQPDAAGIATAANLIKSGDIVAFPTETVYGLGGNALNESAVRAIFEAKGRPLTDPLIVHVSSVDQALGLIDVNESEKRIFNVLSQFWPGPLTVIAKAASIIPALVTANTGFVGVRLPKHPLACRLIEESGLPIAAPSANRFGHVSPTLAKHVLDDLACKGVSVLSGDTKEFSKYTCQHGIESSVIKIDGEKKQILVLRQGAITPKAICIALETCGDADLHTTWSVKVLKKTVDMKHVQKDSNSTDCGVKEEEDQTKVGQEAPGQAITHYAPDIPCMMVHSICNSNSHSNNINSKRNSSSSSSSSIDTYPLIEVSMSDLGSTVIIDYGSKLSAYKSTCLAYTDLSVDGVSCEAANKLFDVLRWTESFIGPAKTVFLPYVMGALESTKDIQVKGSDNFDFNALSVDDIILGLSDRLFRAASGYVVDIVVQEDA